MAQMETIALDRDIRKGFVDGEAVAPTAQLPHIALKDPNQVAVVIWRRKRLPRPATTVMNTANGKFLHLWTLPIYEFAI